MLPKWIIGENSVKLKLEKEDFYSQLNMEDIIDADYKHPKSVCKDFKTKHVWEYHDLYFQKYTLMLADVFENFIKMCLLSLLVILQHE